MLLVLGVFGSGKILQPEERVTGAERVKLFLLPCFCCGTASDLRVERGLEFRFKSFKVFSSQPFQPAGRAFLEYARVER